MKKGLFRLVMLTGMLSVAATAQAQDVTYYAGMGLGTISVDYKATGIDQKKASAGGFAYFGANVNNYLALETRIGVTGKDKKTYAGATTLAFSSPTFFSLLGKLKYPATSNLDLFMLAGLTTARIKGTKTSPAGVVTQTKTKSGASLGAGFDYHASDNISVGAEWVQYLFPVKLSAGKVFAPGSEARMWGITGKVAYHF